MFAVDDLVERCGRALIHDRKAVLGDLEWLGATIGRSRCDSAVVFGFPKLVCYSASREVDRGLVGAA